MIDYVWVDQLPYAVPAPVAKEVEQLRAVLREVVRISDRKHDAWDRAKQLLGERRE